MTFSWHKKLSHSLVYKFLTISPSRQDTALASTKSMRPEKSLPTRTISTMWQLGLMDIPWKLSTKIGKSPLSEKEALITTEQSMRWYGINNSTSRKSTFRKMASVLSLLIRITETN